ncbi:MAG: hypothetical protein AAFR99_23650, partial [Cyanobacteria bacterium J06629_9]
MKFGVDVAADVGNLEDWLQFNLPDPEDDQISDIDFQQRIDQAWQRCDQIDLQNDIWRGRILRAVRDREKKGGDSRGAGFLNWLMSRSLSQLRK